MIDTLRQRDDDNYIDRDMIYTEDEYSDLKEKLEEAENRIEELEDKLNEIERKINEFEYMTKSDFPLSQLSKQVLKIIKGE